MPAHPAQPAHRPHRHTRTRGAADAPRPAVPDLGEQLRARGLRKTPQREQVLGAVRELGHATPEQISEAVDGVDVTTVYRTLELLEDIGLVRHTHLDHRAPAYRPAEDDHIHVVCHACGSVVDAPPGLVDELEQRLLDERGFSLDRPHLTVFGRCADCAEAGEDAPPVHHHGADHAADHAHAEQSSDRRR